MESPNRRLIRPPLAGMKEKPNTGDGNKAVRRTAGPKKSMPPDQTNAENYYYLKQMQTKTPMVIVMRDGEELHGCLEWYDRGCLKLNRQGAPNVLIYKANIKYLYKET